MLFRVISIYKGYVSTSPLFFVYSGAIFRLRNDLTMWGLEGTIGQTKTAFWNWQYCFDQIL